MNKKFGIFLIVLSAINLGITIFTLNIAGIGGWLCALIAQVQLFHNFGDN